MEKTIDHGPHQKGPICQFAHLTGDGHLELNDRCLPAHFVAMNYQHYVLVHEEELPGSMESIWLNYCFELGERYLMSVPVLWYKI